MQIASFFLIFSNLQLIVDSLTDPCKLQTFTRIWITYNELFDSGLCERCSNRDDSSTGINSEV